MLSCQRKGTSAARQSRPPREREARRRRRAKDFVAFPPKDDNPARSLGRPDELAGGTVCAAAGDDCTTKAGPDQLQVRGVRKMKSAMAAYDEGVSASPLASRIDSGKCY